jgi:autocrine motility factor receptor
MPVLQLDSYDILPVPNLQAYTAVSFLLLSFSIYHVFQVTSDSDWKLNATTSYGYPAPHGSQLNERQMIEQKLIQSQQLEAVPWASEEERAEMIEAMNTLISHPYVVRGLDMLFLMFREPLCFWTLINMAFCFLILAGKLIQRVVFGQLRVSEQQNIKEKFWNFVFYKFVFIFGVLNVQYMDEIMLWCSWFSLLGFLSLLAQLCKDRFVYLSFSPTTPKWTHIRLLLLLVTVLGGSSALLLVSFVVGKYAGISTFAIMASECLLVFVRTLYVLVRYSIHLWDLNHDGVWENRSILIYYTEFVFEMVALVVDFFNYLHMLFCGPYFLSLASLVIIMQLRFLFTEIKRRFRKHKNYLQVVRLMELNFPMALPTELQTYSDDCAICWEKMDSARRLPCGHLFHNFCLRSWLEQDTSCPTCRTSLKNRAEQNHGPNSDADVGVAAAQAGQGATNAAAGLDPASVAANMARGEGEPIVDGGVIRNHFYHFDGRRYASWLPSVSVEVSRMNLSIGLVTGNSPLIASNVAVEEENLTSSELESMARQVLEWFPNMSFTAIMDDLRQTRSVNETVENILDGHLVTVEQPIASNAQLYDPQQPSTSAAQSAPLETEVRQRASTM